MTNDQIHDNRIHCAFCKARVDLAEALGAPVFLSRPGGRVGFDVICSDCDEDMERVADAALA